jgi:hypothetical protein
VFADWLDERGQGDRAEFIRTQCALARMPDDDVRRMELEVRERRLLAANAYEWADPWPRVARYDYAGDGPWDARFRRGFLEAIELSALHHHAGKEEDAFGRLLGAHPIREVNVNGIWVGCLPALAGREELCRVESLAAWQWSSSAQDNAQSLRLAQEMDNFLRSPLLTGLRRLTFHLWNVPAELATAWLESPAFARLEAINVPMGHPADEQFLRAVAGGKFPHLHELSLPASDQPSFGVAAEGLVRSTFWPQLQTLTLPMAETFPWSEALTKGQLRRLCICGGATFPENDPPAWVTFGPSPTLEALDLHGDTCQGGLSRLLASDSLANLRRLSLQDGYLNDHVLDRLARSPRLANLTRLLVRSWNGLTELGVAALFGSPHLGRLTWLEVSGGRLSVAAAQALARNPARERLRVLGLPVIQSEAALAALTQGEPFPDLHTLNLSWWRDVGPNPATISALLNSPKLPRLCVVSVCVHERHLATIADAFRSCDRIAWAGGEMGDGGDGVRVSIKPETVYLPNHLDDF